MAYTKQTWTDGSTGTPISAARLGVIEQGIFDAHTIAGTAVAGTNPFGSTLVALSSYSGADDSAKFRNAVNNYPTSGVRPIIVIPSGTTLDSGANNPFVLPSGFHMMGIPSTTDEFSYQAGVNIRHTGSTTTLGVFKMAAGPSKGQKITGISFEGTSSTRAFVDTATDASDAAYWQYVHLHDVSFDQFESIFTGTGTGIIWDGYSYLNNMTCGREPLGLNGSDHLIWGNGGFFEMGEIASYATRAALPAMVRIGNGNFTIGAMYTTGSPTTPYRIDGGATGINFDSVTLEGRPSPGTTLWCAGPLLRMTAGRATVKARHHAYAMRDPQPGVLGYQPGGYYHVTGTTSLSVVGGTFQPYPAANYPAWTRPDGVAVAAGTQPPIGWISGSGARASFIGIARGSNCASIPVVYAASGASVTTDGTVSIVTV